MGDAIGQMLPNAVGVAISPLPVVAVVLILVTPRARSNSIAFLLGWWFGVAAVGGIALAAAGGADPSDEGEPATWVSILKLFMGIGLILLAAKQWQSRPRPGVEPEAPEWMHALETFTPLKAAGMGALLSGPNPKNLLLTVAGAAAIAQAGVSGGEQVIALSVFVLIASLGILVPVGLYFGLGDRSRTYLDELKDWMSRYNAPITAVLLLVLGAKGIGDAMADLL